VGDNVKKFLGIFIVIMVISATVFLVYRSSMTDKKAMTELEKLKALDLVEDYPSTQKEVVDLFSRITKQFYVTENSDKDIAALANQMRHLFDEQLLLNNPYTEYMERLNNEILDYKKSKRVIIAYTIDRITDADQAVVEGEELCGVRVLFDLVDGNQKDIKIYENILLVKVDGIWKVRGWQETDAFFE
jgi:hypothetical protein